MPRIIKVDIAGLEHDITCGMKYGSCRLCAILAHEVK